VVAMVTTSLSCRGDLAGRRVSRWSVARSPWVPVCRRGHVRWPEIGPCPTWRWTPRSGLPTG